MKPTGSITPFLVCISRRPSLNDAVLAGVNAAVEAMGWASAPTLPPGMTRGTSAYRSMPEAAREGMYSSIASRLPV